MTEAVQIRAAELVAAVSFETVATAMDIVIAVPNSPRHMTVRRQSRIAALTRAAHKFGIPHLAAQAARMSNALSYEAVLGTAAV